MQDPGIHLRGLDNLCLAEHATYAVTERRRYIVTPTVLSMNTENSSAGLKPMIDIVWNAQLWVWLAPTMSNKRNEVQRVGMLAVKCPKGTIY